MQLTDPARAAGVSRRSTFSRKSTDQFRLIVAAVLATIACLFLLASDSHAAAPSGQDQYLEQVPNAGGKSGSGANDNYAQSVGGSNGQVTEEDVKRAAEKHKKKHKGATGETGGTGATAAGPSGPTTAAPAESVANAAKIGPFSRSAALAILAIIVLVGGAALYQRSRRGTPPGGPPPPSGP